MNSIELPVLARFHIGRIYLNAGPSMAYNFSGNRKFSDETSSSTSPDSIDGLKMRCKCSSRRWICNSVKEKKCYS
ncbi:MAG: outer membrane beta-barrel protein [Bacteroidetes bacterium]|nr:outer membrane beta-barrel protein [Bacteroidota bacterium]